MSIRALFLDLDGTLVGASNRVSPRVREAVREAEAQGVAVVICTGRSRITTEPIADQLGVRAFAVVSNGALVMHLDTREVIACHRMEIEHALGAVRTLIDAGVRPEVYEDTLESARILYHPEHAGRIHNRKRQIPWPELTERLPFAPICVSAFGDEVVVRPIADRLEASPPVGTMVQQAGTHEMWCLEIHHPESGKHSGLRHLCRRLGLAPEETLAIGDHRNDIALLQLAGIGVAMGNALPEVQAAADYVTGSQAEDGVAQAIEQFVLS